jgi:hypothetical protein
MTAVPTACTLVRTKRKSGELDAALMMMMILLLLMMMMMMVMITDGDDVVDDDDDDYKDGDALIATLFTNRHTPPFFVQDVGSRRVAVTEGVLLYGTTTTGLLLYLLHHYQ